MDSNRVGEYTSTSWTPPKDMRWEEWLEVGNTLQQMAQSINWWIGDWLNAGSQRYGETYAQGVRDMTGWKVDRLRDAKWVSANVPPWVRVDPELLSWTHHKYVAHLYPEEQEHWLRAALDNKWSSRELKDALAEANQGSDLEEIDLDFGDEEEEGESIPWKRRYQELSASVRPVLPHLYDGILALFDEGRLDVDEYKEAMLQYKTLSELLGEKLKGGIG